MDPSLHGTTGGSFCCCSSQDQESQSRSGVSRDDIISLKYQRYPSRVSTEANLYLTSGSAPHNSVGEYEAARGEGSTGKRKLCIESMYMCVFIHPVLLALVVLCLTKVVRGILILSINYKMLCSFGSDCCFR